MIPVVQEITPGAFPEPLGGIGGKPVGLGPGRGPRVSGEIREGIGLGFTWPGGPTPFTPWEGSHGGGAPHLGAVKKRTPETGVGKPQV